MSRNRKIAFLFSEDGPASPAALGGKGAGLVELVRLGVPTPPGFTLTTGLARSFSRQGVLPKRLMRQLAWSMSGLERATGKSFGDPGNPLLVSVRSGASVSMPGMMDTVLNLGLNPKIVERLAETTNERFAWDSYRRFLQMFADVVLGLGSYRFQEMLADIKIKYGTASEQELGGQALHLLCKGYRNIIKQEIGRPMIDNVNEQLQLAIVAVLQSWNNPRARLYRKQHQIAEHLGTAVNVQSMVFGNRDERSATGVVFSRNVSTGDAGLYGEFLPTAQGEDVVAGTHSARPISEMELWNPAVYGELADIVRRLESTRNHPVDVEFTVDSGRLYVLQLREAKLTPTAAVTIASNLVWQGRLSKQEALNRVSPRQVRQVNQVGFDENDLEKAIASNRRIARGLPASLGTAVGRAAFTSEEAVELSKRGQSVILIRLDTSPQDLPGFLAADAIVTMTGGFSSHAAVVARDLGKPAVVGVGQFVQDVDAGDTISVNATTGDIISGEVTSLAIGRTKPVNIFLKWWKERESALWPKPRLAFEKFHQETGVLPMLHDFYAAERIAATAVDTPLEKAAASLKIRVHSRTAEHIAMYLILAIASELRHTKAETMGKDRIRTELNLLKQVFNAQLTDESERGRRRAQHAIYHRLKSAPLEEAVEYLDLAQKVFLYGRWDESFGGKAWAAIAKAVHDFLTGAVRHSTFADNAFDLQHNSGAVFDKHKMLTGESRIIQSELDFKKRATGIRDLCDQFCGSYRSWNASGEVRQLYNQGKRMNIW